MQQLRKNVVIVTAKIRSREKTKDFRQQNKSAINDNNPFENFNCAQQLKHLPINKTYLIKHEFAMCHFRIPNLAWNVKEAFKIIVFSCHLKWEP